MLPECAFCEKPVDRRENDVYLEQVGFALIRQDGGTNALSLRRDTGRAAHGPCVRLAVKGINPRDQGQLV